MNPNYFGRDIFDAWRWQQEHAVARNAANARRSAETRREYQDYLDERADQIAHGELRASLPATQAQELAQPAPAEPDNRVRNAIAIIAITVAAANAAEHARPWVEQHGVPMAKDLLRRFRNSQ